uniref:RNA-directed DNA polymerase, eukaryota n=1 Tax=Tanacetum cinerariifolium TaxID=118510 RepID=A0A6L2MFR5_TANCI|nr:RNA-directed DNA polymerase, eukaryota [Tanacetum cinerariifolium]
MGFYKQNSLQSKFDQASRISKSVFVSNFQEGCTPKDLWKVCNDYGTLVDVFIPNKPKKLVFPTYKDMPAAPSNLTGFRQPKAQDHAGSYVNVVNDSSTVVVPGPYISFASALVLDDSCVVKRDLSKYAMGKVKDVNSIPNLQTLLMDEGFSDVKLKYLGGMWVMFEFDKVDTKVNMMQHIGVKSWFHVIQDAVYDFVNDERIVWVDIEGIPLNVWSRKTFMRIAHSPFSEEVSGDDSESDVEEVSETIFGDNSSSPNNNSDEIGKQHSKDSFKIYDILKKQIGGEIREVSSSLSHPPGFTPEVSEIRKENDQGVEEFLSLVNAKGIQVVFYVCGRRTFSRKTMLRSWITSLPYMGPGRWNGETIILGDFNEVRSIHERRGSCFNPSSARVFDHFISSSGLVDVKLEGYAFTWSHPSGSKMSKLDRFLVSEGIFLIFPSIRALCLDRHLLDHRSILLHEVYSDFGLIPFRFYHSWFSLEGFDAMVEQTWCSFSHSDVNRMIHFKKKLQDLKAIIRCAWSYNVSFMTLIRWKLKVKEAFFNHFEARFKKPVAHRFMLNFPFNKRLSDMQAADLERNVSRDEIRLAVWNYGENKSLGPDGYTFEFFRKYWNIVGPDFCEAVEYFFETGLFSKGCNSCFIALIPKVADAKFVNYFRPISLIGSVYKVVMNILANRLPLVIVDLVFDTQSAFVANKQILDGPFILNEILHWCKRKKKQAMFFKVDFAKAYDSVRWDYLLDVLEAFGFGQTWCKWIRGTFSSTRASVLVNGSPYNEFSFHCGLKQDDLFSPYLFILIMESLHMSFSRAVDEGLFKGVHLQGSISISHLFYADDAMFIGEWSDVNLKGIVNILQCFFLASRLKINIHKSQVLGVGIPRSIVMQAASSIGCGVMHNQFRYLRVMAGECMSRHQAWDDTVLKLRSRLSNWKVKTLSIGGRLTLLKSVLGASPLYNISILRRLVWAGSEHQQMVDWNSLLESVSLSHSHDRWFCDLTGDGEYRVKESWFSSIHLPSKVKNMLEGRFRGNLG